MLRLGKSLGCAVLAAAWLMMPTAQASAQAPTPQATMPQAPTSSHPSAPALSPNAPPRHKKASPVAEAPSTPPPPPPTLEQSTPTPPRVSFQNGQLTIDATNSTLSQVLRAVQSRTGASIDIPAGAGNERVVAQLGPGQPRDVLNTLLNGSKFDYVILGVTGGNPGAVQKVILTPRQGGATITAQSNTPRQPVQEDESQVDESPPVADTAENEYQNPDQPPPPPGGFRHPMMPPGGQVNPGAEFGNGDQNGPKTPEQLMQQMQQQQQQQQQYQQQLNPANQNPPPQ
jgi:guanyl-specific ribonuclease Sa